LLAVSIMTFITNHAKDNLYRLITRTELGQLSRYGDWLRAERLVGGSSPSRIKNFHFSISPRPALGSTQPPIKCVLGALSQG
jgi:hypothetical protein